MIDPCVNRTCLFSRALDWAFPLPEPPLVPIWAGLVYLILLAPAEDRFEREGHDE